MTIKAEIQVDSLLEHGTGLLNEDVLVVEDNLFCVFDGATSLSPETYEHGYTGGYLASNLAGEAFRQNNGSLLELSQRANRRIHRAMVERHVDVSNKGKLWSTSAAAVRMGEDSFEWAQIGDSRILCIMENGDLESVCEIRDHDVETLCLWKDVCQCTSEPIAEALHEQIVKVRSRMNVDYGVFSGEPEAMDFLQTGTRDLCGVSHVLLFTDGLLVPKADPLQQRDFDTYIELFLTSGLKGVRDYIRSVEATDAGCRAYPRFKMHDDIAAIAISV
ncbi:MAG: protein phosphatase 2C domain-containing protein [Desulfovibrio sp.]|uniref:protein phosphatase 2C domain-containing protein n=1 Tax=Desulfovibrio sp. 7SRBS1 TaxID=3378064 RepID=UPI003B3D6966